MSPIRTLAPYELAPPPTWRVDKKGTKLLVPAYDSLLRNGRKMRTELSIKTPEERDYRLGFFLVDFALTFVRMLGELTLYPAAMKNVNNARRFVCRNLRVITSYDSTIDGHSPHHIGNRTNWLDANGNPPDSIVQITVKNFEKEWFLNRDAAFTILGDASRWDELREHVYFLVRKLEARGIPLTIWPLHGILGGIDSCIVPSLHHDILLASFASGASNHVHAKGLVDLYETFSPFGTGVTRFFDGTASINPNEQLLKRLMHNDVLILAGEALSHCVGMALLDLIDYALDVNPELLTRIYLLSDCTSPVPGFEAQAEKILARAKEVGVNIVPSTLPMHQWPKINKAIFAELGMAG